MSVIDGEADEIAEKILSIIEHASSKELASSTEIAEILHLTDARHAKKLLQHMDNVSTQSERNVGKVAVIKALLMSTWLQRLYFVARSAIMGILSATITFSFIFVFGSINSSLQIILGIVSFAFALTVSRLFDQEIVKLTKTIIEFLSNHRSLRAFIINHF